MAIPHNTKRMPKTDSPNARTSGHETLTMTLALLDMIPKVGKISTTQICERLRALGYERNVRSIQRQLEALSESFPIERDDSSKPYGYKWQSDATGISIPALTLQESLLLSMAEKYLRNLLPPSVTKSMESIFSQARYNMRPGDDAKLEKRWLSKVRVVSANMPLLPPEISPGVLEAVRDGLNNALHTEVAARNFSNAEISRAVS